MSYFDGIVIRHMSSGARRASAFSSYDPAIHRQEDLLELLSRHEKEWLAEVESAIALVEIPWEIDLTGFSEATISIVSRRAETVCSFLDSLHVSGVSIFGLPQVPFGKCVRWLMVDWWQAHGMQMTVDIFLSER